MSSSRELIEFIATNAVSTSEISDALGKSDSMPDLYPINTGLQHAVGEIFYCYAFSNSNYSLHKQLKDAPEDSIVFIDVFDFPKNTAVVGDLTLKFLFLYRKVKAVVINGYCRELIELFQLNILSEYWDNASWLY